MKQNHEMPNQTLQAQDSNLTNNLKVWETPSLKVLPVPSRTQGGPVTKNDQDDAYYKKS